MSYRLRLRKARPESCDESSSVLTLFVVFVFDPLSLKCSALLFSSFVVVVPADVPHYDSYKVLLFWCCTYLSTICFLRQEKVFPLFPAASSMHSRRTSSNVCASKKNTASYVTTEEFARFLNRLQLGMCISARQEHARTWVRACRAPAQRLPVARLMG